MTRSADECSPTDTAEHVGRNPRRHVRSLPARLAAAYRTPDPGPSEVASTPDAHGHAANSPTSHPASDGPIRAIPSNPEDQEFLPASSCARPFESALAEYLRDFHLVVFVPAFTSGVL